MSHMTLVNMVESATKLKDHWTFQGEFLSRMVRDNALSTRTSDYRKDYPVSASTLHQVAFLLNAVLENHEWSPSGEFLMPWLAEQDEAGQLDLLEPTFEDFRAEIRRVVELAGQEFWPRSKATL